MHALALQVQGQWQLSVGSEGDQPGEFDFIQSLALTPDEAYLLVVEGRENNRLVVLQATDGAWVRHLTGPPNTLDMPDGVAVVPSTGRVLVTNKLYQVVEFQSIEDDTVTGVFGTGRGDGPTEFDHPGFGIVVLDALYCPPVLSDIDEVYIVSF